MRHWEKTFSDAWNSAFTAHMYPLRPLKAELIPLAKLTEGLGNEEVDYKLSLSLFWVCRTKRTRHENDHECNLVEAHKRDKQSLLSFQAVALVSHAFFDACTSVLR